MSKQEACPHVGKYHPREFQCLDCNDTADKCNCFDCMGVFCDYCNTMVWIERIEKLKVHLALANCHDVVDLWEETQQGFAEEKKDCLGYDTCKKYTDPKEPLDCDACGHYMTTGMY